MNSFRESGLQSSHLRPLLSGKTKMTSKKLAIYSAPKHDPGIRITAYEDYQHDEYKGPHIGSYPSVQENKVSLGLRKFRGRKKTLLLLRAQKVFKKSVNNPNYQQETAAEISIS